MDPELEGRVEGEREGAEEDSGRPQRPMSPAREKLFGDVLAGMESGEDTAGAKAKPPAKAKPAAKSSDKAKESSSSSRSSSKPALPAEEDEDDSDVDAYLAPDGDEEDDDDEEGDEEITEDERPRRADPAEDDDEDEEGEGDEGEVGEEDDDEVDAPASKAHAKSVAQIAQLERRSKERIRRDREEAERAVEAKVREWEPRIQAAQRVEALERRAAINPVGAIVEFAETVAKLKPDDWVLAARGLFAKSPRAQDDPKTREAAISASRESELRARVEAQDQKIDALLGQLNTQRQQEHDSQAAHAYVERAVRAISKESPLTRRMFKERPKTTRVELHRLAVRLAEENGGRAVTPAKVVAAFEKRQRVALKAMGVDVKALFFKKKPATDDDDTKTKTTKKSAEKTKAKNGANGKATPIDPRDRRALHADVLAGMPERS